MKRRNGIMVLGTGRHTVKIYTVRRADGYPQFSVAWREAGGRRLKIFADMESARLHAQQTLVKLQNGTGVSADACLRDIEMLRHCEDATREFKVSLIAAVEEWASAKRLVDGASLTEAAQFFAKHRTDRMPQRSLAEVADEFIESRIASGVTAHYIQCVKSSLKLFNAQVRMQIADVTTETIDNFLRKQKTHSAVTKNNMRRTLVVLFGFARKRGYLPEHQKTAPEQSGSFKEADTPVEIFTPEEMRKLLQAAPKSLLPLVAIGGFAGIRTAEIQRLEWQDIKWDRGHIEIAGRKAKTAARRLVPLSENLRAWLAPWRDATGLIVSRRAVSGALCELGAKAKIEGGWKKNALRHSYISCRVALTGDVARTSLECGNSPDMVFRHYREIVSEEQAKEWFKIIPE